MDMLKLATDIAGSLRGTWIPDDKDHSETYARLWNADGAGIVIWRDRRAEKFIIRGAWPKARDGREFSPPNKDTYKIGVSDTRDIKDITNEITRRMLPGYLLVFEKARAEVRAHNVYLDSQSELTAHFAKLVRGKVRQNTGFIDGGPPPGLRIGRMNGMYVNASEETINFHLCDVPAALAEKMLRTWMGD